MTQAEFVMKIQNYYGKYPKGQFEAIAMYLQTKNALYLDALYQTCILRFSSKWKTPPDVAIFEELRAETLQRAKENLAALPTPERNTIEEKHVSTAEAKTFLQNLMTSLSKKKIISQERIES